MDEQQEIQTVPPVDHGLHEHLELGAVSLSLAVAPLAPSQVVYERLGFVVTGGDPEANYLILKNDETTLALSTACSTGASSRSTRNDQPDAEAGDLPADVRVVQRTLEEAGLTQRADPAGSGRRRSRWSTPTPTATRS